MRKRFEIQLDIGQIPISEIDIDPKSRNALEHLIAALKELYCDREYNDKIFRIIEAYKSKVDHNNGRPGMNLWTIFVLSQVRMCLGLSYDMLHNLSNNHDMLRKILGICDEFGKEKFKFEYQNIYHNVSSLSEDMLKEINDVIVEFGHSEVFERETAALCLKTDSFVVESNVHFPTDYNLLWDCIRKCLDVIEYFLKKYPEIEGWRNIKSWRSELKAMMRNLGRANGRCGKNKQEKCQRLLNCILLKVDYY